MHLRADLDQDCMNEPATQVVLITQVQCAGLLQRQVSLAGLHTGKLREISCTKELVGGADVINQALLFNGLVELRVRIKT